MFLDIYIKRCTVLLEPGRGQGVQRILFHRMLQVVFGVQNCGCHPLVVVSCLISIFCQWQQHRVNPLQNENYKCTYNTNYAKFEHLPHDITGGSFDHRVQNQLSPLASW